MRYSTDYKEQARANLIEASGRHAKEHGFASSGMADMAAAAGVTTGSLYKHFDGKSDLLLSMITAELKRTAYLYAAIEPGDEAAMLTTLASYLSMSHVQHPEAGCPLPSLTAEIARADDDVKIAFEQGVQTIHANVESLTGDAEAAWALIAQNVGAVMIARAIKSPSLQRELLRAVRHSAERLVGGDASN